MIERLAIDANAAIDLMRADRADPAPIAEARAILLPLPVLGELFTGAFSSRRPATHMSEIEESLIERASIFVFAILTGNQGTAFVEHARENDIPAQPHARAAGRMLRQVGSVKSHHVLSLFYVCACLFH